MKKVLTETETRKGIRYLFDEIWPEMERSPQHRDACLANAALLAMVINSNRKYGDKAVKLLDQIPGIGPTIASGLMHVVSPKQFVPFDKWTTGYAVQLGVIPDNKIMDHYAAYCAMVRSHLRGKRKSILEFVRDAGKSQFPCNPE